MEAAAEERAVMMAYDMAEKRKRRQGRRTASEGVKKNIINTRDGGGDRTTA